MPTMGRLAGAIFFGIVGGVLAWLLVPFFEETRTPKLWFPLCGVVGVLIGWIFVGPRTGQGTGVAIGTGLTGAILVAFWVLFLLSGSDMIRVSMRGRFDGPMDAVVGTFGIMAEYAQQFYAPVILVALLGGGIVAGLLTDAFGKRYR
ncbi:TrgA family protein [Loktanella sp. M215]|uniref:TrgA family protein n=1 Tax=Loktanella sp. M215 TaxID=2675431 RepID=UPI001F191790|nr:TrgA family protein [Loktanella sp. M215]MCF7700791.1 TrgA family protein [Loktanella sp. M215]